jgi:flagellar hook-associated protein 2
MASSQPIAQFSGLASGIDSKSLIDAIIAAKQTVNDKRRQDIEFLSGENDALEDLNTKLLSLNDLIDPLRTANAGGLSKKGSSSDPTVATAIVGSNANNASYSLNVTSIANSATASFDQGYASGSSYISTSNSGNIAITVGTGADQVVVYQPVAANSTTLDSLVAAINADPNASGRVAASAVNVGTPSSPNYQLVVTSLQSGTAKGTLALAADVSLPELQAHTVEQATDAVFSISGISGTITRTTNSVDDVISGLTFNLQKAGTTTINVTNDADTTADKISEIVDAYNEVVKYIGENDTVTQDTTSTDKTVTFGSLAKTHVDNDFLSFFRDSMASATAASGTAVKSLSEIGLSTNRDGTLAFDADKFKAAVGDDPVGVGQVLNDFADKTAGVNGSIYQFTKLAGFIDTAEQSNNTQITNLNDSIAALDRQTDKLRDSLTKQFANLETITSKLQNDQQALSGILAGIS